MTDMSTRSADVMGMSDVGMDVRAFGVFHPMSSTGALPPTGPVWAAMDRRAWKQARREWRRQHRSRHVHFPLPLILLLVFFGVTHIGAIVGLVMLMALTIALCVAGVVLTTRVAIPMLRSAFLSADTPVAMPAPARPVLAVPAGPHAYRQQLLDVLKDRYVRGEITLAEYETRVGQVVRDPSVRHLG